MNGKQSKRLRKLVANTSTGSPNRDRYQTMKRLFNDTPKNKRGKLMEALQSAADTLKQESKAA